MLLKTDICEFGFKAPDFKLPDLDGSLLSLDDVKGEKGVLIAFICNHCPYVKAIITRLVSDAKDLQAAGIGVAAIMPNDYTTHPDDAPDKMKLFAQDHGFTFPYLLDESQKVARAYDAICTPDFFGFNADLELQYRGCLDEGRLEDIPGAKRELRDAMLEIAKTGQGPKEQSPSMGCSIKWR